MSLKIGIITFHASYNCGSMLQTYALQTYLKKSGYDVEIIDFSNKGQKKLYSLYSSNKSLKYLIRNCLFYLHRGKILNNYKEYELFKTSKFNLSSSNYDDCSQIDVSKYDVLISGSDQVWNVTIADFDDAYFLPWNHPHKVAYAPSFGAKNPIKHFSDISKIKSYLMDFEAVSVRENNGRKWVKELINQDVPVVLDPTLLLEKSDYEPIVDELIDIPEKYIFYYCPTYSIGFNKMVRRISKKYHLPVVAFNSKAYYLRGMDFSGFILPKYENPSVYLRLMKNAEMVITTSFHGTVFSTIFQKKFWVIKNGGMYATDDRVITLLSNLGIEDRLVEMPFDDSFDYCCEVDYKKFSECLNIQRCKSQEYLSSVLEHIDETAK